MTRGRWILLILLAGSLTAAGALTYKNWPQLFRKASNQQPATSSSQDGGFSIPPFSTKEPDRYQATRIITSVEDKNGSVVTVSKRILIARDGDRRREEYASGANETVVYLETPEGRFVLAPAKKLYADLNLAVADPGSFTAPNDAADFSPERLLNESPAVARYEKMGAETIEGRATTKYRVTAVDTASGVESVTLIWIDDALGMPVRSETSSTASDHTVKVTVELRDLKQTIDPGIFELPKDYLKVEYRRLFAEMSQVRDTQARGTLVLISVEANLARVRWHPKH